MSHFAGLDLGTTNSAICTYDGVQTRIWKSPEQNDVTPSAIYIDRRGNKYVGKRAYDSAPYSPDNAAMLFKRLMGTNTPIRFPAVNLTKTPEECSAEILKVLFGYLPEEIRNHPDTGAVITVPAAFNQMQKDATMQAAQLAGIGRVALMQEPVAAVMSVMRQRNSDGMFVIYDFGGGTLDVAVAESIGGRVNLLAHGGIAMCGGRDFDRVVFDSIVRPWLSENFDLPDDFITNPQYKSLVRLGTWSAEKAKIELSARDEVSIALAEAEVRAKDRRGVEIYLDIPMSRNRYDRLIEDRVRQSIGEVRETLSKVGLTSHDIERIVFVGGPTNYKPMRDMVSFELGIPGNTDVNAMTAVAEGASLFAESIDWSSLARSRKSSRGQLSASGSLKLSFNYISRTSDPKSKVVVQLDGSAASGCEFQIDSIDTGWTTGRLPLKQGSSLEISLARKGENIFKVFVFDAAGGSLALAQDRIIITRTAATIDAIPASHSVGIEVLERLGGTPILDYLVRAGDQLPKKGQKVYKSAESLKAGAPQSINFKLWEGDIDDPVRDNRAIGVLKISGSDFEDGVIPAGADLECDYQILDSGNIILEISVPCISGSFHSGKNFYSRQEGQLDYSASSSIIIEEGQRTLNRMDSIQKVLAEDPSLEQARLKLEKATSLNPQEGDAESVQEAMENVLEARKLIAQIRKEHLKEIRQIELDRVIDLFNQYVRQHARPSEVTSFNNLGKTAQRSISKNERDFEHHLEELKGKNFNILWRQDWFVIDRFNGFASSPHLFIDKARFEELCTLGAQSLRSDEIDKLRSVVAEMYSIRLGGGNEDDIYEEANIVRG